MEPRTTLTAEDVTNLREVIESQSRLGHEMTIVPNDVLVRLLAAASPVLDVERLASAMDDAFEPDDKFVDDHEAFWRPFAVLVVREYAALRATEKAEP